MPTSWSTVGPVGGDARAFATVPGQPNHLYLGTTNSWLYESLNGGATWHRLSKLDSSDHLILDHIIVDRANPTTIYVAAWKLNQPGGGLWVSHDGGRNWKAVEGLRGQSIRAFAQAPSNPKVFFAGTLDGVFRSNDAGTSWTLISPPKSQDIHEVESLAIDPVNSDVIYAGTWHLPWKTTDGGKNWRIIKQGLIEDSDVFSIIIDPVQPRVVFASACSGIYKSENAAELFMKVKGIPTTARRTRVLKQDPANSNVVYAGTTEGLYKSRDGGQSFKRMTGPEVIVNDVYIDPQDSNHVLLATDSSGVLLSRNAAVSFVAANEGFSGRKVEALLVDHDTPARLYAGVVNDKNYGGVFVSTNNGAGWRQIGDGQGGGLGGRDVFVLAQSPQGMILAGTNHGIFALVPGTAHAPDGTWIPRNTVQSTTVQNTLVKKTSRAHCVKCAYVEKRTKNTANATSGITGRVHALDLSSDVWLASTSNGLFTSRNHGASWQGGPVMGESNYFSIAVHGSLMAAVRWDKVALSSDAGLAWNPVSVPAKITRIYCITFSADGTLWMGAREGLYFTRDGTDMVVG